MPLLQDLQRIFRRRPRPAAVDLAATQARGLGPPAAGNGASPGGLDLIEPKPARMRGNGDLARSHEEVMGLVRRIGDHLDGQTERTGRLLEMMERLPTALDALPEINRQNARLLEVLHDHFCQAKRREEALNAAISTIGETSGRQTEVLGLLQQHLDAGSRAAASLTGTLETMHRALSDLAASNDRSISVLERMTEAAAEREGQLAATISRTQHWMIFAVFFCGAASVMAIVVATLALTR